MKFCIHRWNPNNLYNQSIPSWEHSGKERDGIIIVTKKCNKCFRHERYEMLESEWRKYTDSKYQYRPKTIKIIEKY